ncbi:hypothetical protein SERLA73DRAFT_176613 [Serpula lacrymans var. lacrymans S7.3]|uniref:Uncharacterized protein n=2 Tax=Serpula lacrymans var. lacrymans TaxID=341189 RepID=F8PNB7_SERL3|nr:uncharacterized protein SERLADRAFT_459702 [Serpula lacrymans var. lacrymans S7.9]EGO03099.1 hypothetical protein SERLA73DRAFT_176613 [Serpula lacrymans var. lacrymans S7.3]EGO28861.1 hypothetical protein SERLADRAFT_459702 [Serpula lacrymans var. lacrymans S7.9]
MESSFISALQIMSCGPKIYLGHAILHLAQCSGVSRTSPPTFAHITQRYRNNQSFLSTGPVSVADHI